MGSKSLKFITLSPPPSEKNTTLVLPGLRSALAKMASVFQLEENVLFGFGVGFAGVLMLLSLFIVKGVVDLSSPSRKRSLKKTKAGKYIEIDDEMLTRFSKAIQCQTVSYSISENDEPWNKDELIKLHQHIRICKYLQMTDHVCREM